MSERKRLRSQQVPPVPAPPPAPPPVPPPPPVQNFEVDLAHAEYGGAPLLVVESTDVRRPRKRKRLAIIYGIMHVVAPLAGLSLGWLILGTIRPDLSFPALLHELQPTEVAPQRPQEPPAIADDAPHRERRPPIAPSLPVPSPPPAGTLREQAEPLPLSTALLDAQPDAVDLPPFGGPNGETGRRAAVLADLDAAAGRRCELVLVSDEIAEQPETRLRLEELPSADESQTWAVRLTQDEDVMAEPLAEFSWRNGQLLFRWRYATAGELRAALVNSLLNINIEGHEKLVRLRTPLTPPGLTLDLTQRRLRSTHDLHHLPPLDQLRVTVTHLELPSGLTYRLEEDNQTAGVGRKVPIQVTTPPGVNFSAWLGMVADQLTFHVEGHYSMPGWPSLEFTQKRVEAQARSLLANHRAASRRLPALDRLLSQSEKAVQAAENRLRRAPTVISRGIAQADLSRLQWQYSAIKSNIARTRQAIPVLAHNFAVLQEVGKLGNQIHNEGIIQYRVHLLIEHDGIPFDVVLLETSGRAVGAMVDGSVAFRATRLIDADNRSPIPPEAQRVAAREQLATEFREQYIEAQDAAAKQRLAELFVEQAAQVSEAPPRQFELFRLAWMILAPLDLEAALEIADQIEQLFDVPRVPLRAAVAQAAAKAAGSNEQKAAVVQAALDISGDATTSTEDYIAAVALLTLAEELVQTIGNPTLLQQVQERNAILQGEQTLNEEDVRSLLEPGDVERQLRVGRLGLAQGRDWDHCMETLAEAGDAPLAEAARLDLSLPEEPTAQKELADHWFELAKSETAAVSQRLQERAAFWYAKALPQLSGLSHAAAEARLKVLEADSKSK